MKNRLLQTGSLLPVTAAVFLLIFASMAEARGTAKVTDEEKLKAEISILNTDVSMPNGDRVVLDRLSKEFDVTSDKITALRDRGLGFGEIAAVYAFADKMEGGITDANINRIMSMQQGKEGWGKIASNLDVDLRDVSKKVGDIEKSVHDGIKQAAVEGPETGAAAGGGSDGRMEEPDRSEPLYQ